MTDEEKRQHRVRVARMVTAMRESCDDNERLLPKTEKRRKAFAKIRVLIKRFEASIL